MLPTRSLLPILCMLLYAGNAVAAGVDLLSDSLQHVLSHTSEPEKRIDLLLNLKDLNEETELNLPLSIQLFREAAVVSDTYAMGVAFRPILNRYGMYAEKEDSLHFYILTLQKLTPGTPQEGIDAFAQMSIGIDRLRAEYDQKKRAQKAEKVLEWCRPSISPEENIYHHIRQLILRGYASTQLLEGRSTSREYASRIASWEKAYALIRELPQPAVRIYFAADLYPLLASAYTETLNYRAQTALSNDYIQLLDNYFGYEYNIGRRPYLYTDNAYVLPYKHLIHCAYAIGAIGHAEAHYQQFRRRMLAAEGKDLLRNKSYLYEIGALWQEAVGNYNRSLLFCDSLVNLVESGKGYFRMLPAKIIKVYRDRSRLLARTGSFKQAFTAYDRAYEVMDSIYAIESDERLVTIRRSNDMNRMQLAEARAQIRSHVTALISAACVVLLLIAAGVYLYRGLRRNRKLQGGIIRLSRKAEESERMKSNFLNSVCNDIRAPFQAIDQAAWRLMVSEMSEENRSVHIDVIRRNTTRLLSTLDNMLEAASLDSLSEKLRFEQTDIHALCRAELQHTSRQYENAHLEFIFEGDIEKCLVYTHARYFSFIVRTILGNAAKFTDQGCITLRCQPDIARNTLHISVSDTGPGISPEHRAAIFSTGTQNPAAERGQSLALCSLIAQHMRGRLRLDESYSPGARFIFTIPINP